MNNKQLGTWFERKLCDLLSFSGYWVHFIAPDMRGSQPFDVIAVKDGKALAIDCKTCERHVFTINRLEDNQIMAFEKWLSCGNEMPLIAVEHKGLVYMIKYSNLKKNKKIDLRSMKPTYWIIEH